MRRVSRWAVGLTVGLLGLGAAAAGKWQVHDPARPAPPAVTPGESYGQPPSDAIVLFDGKDLSKWAALDGSAARWKVENGYAEINKTGSIRTREGFGDVQLHLEFAAPQSPQGEGQHRGNSGIWFMSRYELQILDAYNNATYADGTVGALYGQQPPLVNVARKPGEWQTYDVVFHRPIFEAGKVVRPGRVTALLNGVVVQDNAPIQGTTVHGKQAQYQPHADAEPIQLQDHNDNQPVRFRNIWVRKLGQVE